MKIITQAGDRLVASLFLDHAPSGYDDGDQFALADLDLDSGVVSLLLGPSTTRIEDTDWSPDEHLVVAMDNDLYLVDPATANTTLISPGQFVAATPTWSADGGRIA